MTTILKTVFGSHLYGCATASSDYDYKEIFVPSFRSLITKGALQLTNNTTNTGGKNTAADVDTERFSIAQFMEFGCESQTVAIDMLHSSSNHWMSSSDQWNYVQSHRDIFLNKNMYGILGYIKKQVHKYNNKVERLDGLQKAREFLLNCDPLTRMKLVWDALPLDDAHLFKVSVTGPNSVPVECYEVMGRRYMPTVTVGEVLKSINKMWMEYGHRAKTALTQQNVDWKAVHHAFRACLQAKYLLRDGKFEYPLPDTDLLMDIKRGDLSFDDVGPRLDHLYNEVMEMISKSDLPDKVDRQKVEEILMSVYEMTYGPMFKELLLG